MKKKLFIATLVTLSSAILIGVPWYLYFNLKDQNIAPKVIPIQVVSSHIQQSGGEITPEEIERSFFIFASSNDSLNAKDQELLANLEDWLLERFAPLILNIPRQHATIHQTKMLLFWCCSNKSSYKINWLQPSNTNSYRQNLLGKKFLDEQRVKGGFQVFSADGPLLRSSNHVYDQASLQKATRAISRSFHQSQLYEFLNDVPMLKERVLGVDRNK